MSFQNLFCGILFCISAAALIIACLAFTNKGGGKGEYYEDWRGPCPPNCITLANQCLDGSGGKASEKACVTYNNPRTPYPCPMYPACAKY